MITTGVAPPAFVPFQEVERYVLYNIDDDTQFAQAMITNQIDETHDLRVDTVETILRENPATTTTYTGRDADGEYGMVSWWPISLHLNNLQPHLDNANVRKAITKYIDRDRLNAQAYLNKGRINNWPWPQYAGLKLTSTKRWSLWSQEFNIGQYDKDGADALLTEAGYSMNSDGFWADGNGEVIKCNIISSAHFTDLGPVVAALLEQHGIESSWAQPPGCLGQKRQGRRLRVHPSWSQRFAIGGHISDVVDRTQLKMAANRWSYSNPEFDSG